MIQKSKLLAPSEFTYSPLFVVAILYLVVGTFIWPLSMFFQIQSQNIVIFHKLLVFGGFLTSFADGFFLTALPGFTRTNKPSNLYILFILFFKFLILFSLMIDFVELGILSCLLSSTLVLFFGIRCIIKKSGIFPPSLYFVVIAIINSIIYFSINLYLICSDQNVQNTALENLIQIYFPINLMMGVGIKIIPVFFGIPQRGCFHLSKNKLTDFLNDNKAFLYLLFFNLTIILDYFDFLILGNVTRVISLLIIFVKYFQIHKPIKVQSYVTLGMRSSLWIVLLGLILRSFNSTFIFGAHIYFIGGIASFTFMVASRITLSHGGFSLDFERKTRRIHFVSLFFGLAAIFRFLPVMTDIISYEILILCSWFSVMIAIYFWLNIYGTKLIAPLKRRS